MRIVLCGAAREVTGSAYLVETATARVLVDFGMFQGSRATEAGACHRIEANRR
jgi:metallo-beta-lactamase family protein